MMLPMRLALRSGIVRALNNNGEAPYPTIAGFAVFDSKMDPIEHVLKDSVMPVIIVYSADDNLSLLDTGSGRGAYQRAMTVIIELMVGTYQTKDGTGDGFNVVETDAEIEAMLDLLEWQVWRTFFDQGNQVSNAVQGLIKKLLGWHSVPHRSAENANRFAMRQIEMTVEVSQDCQRQFATGTPPAIAETDDPLGIPYLTEFSNVIATNEAFAGLKDDLLGKPRVLPRLKTVAVRLDRDDDNALPREARQMGRDGRTDFNINMKD